jgi:hypothetical protein
MPLDHVNKINQLSVGKPEVAGAAAQNIGLMQAVFLRHILSTGPIELELLIAPPWPRHR